MFVFFISALCRRWFDCHRYVSEIVFNTYQKHCYFGRLRIELLSGFVCVHETRLAPVEIHQIRKEYGIYVMFFFHINWCFAWFQKTYLSKVICYSFPFFYHGKSPLNHQFGRIYVLYTFSKHPTSANPGFTRCSFKSSPHKRRQSGQHNLHRFDKKVQPGDPAPDFTLPASSGGEARQRRGGKEGGEGYLEDGLPVSKKKGSNPQFCKTFIGHLKGKTAPVRGYTNLG